LTGLLRLFLANWQLATANWQLNFQQPAAAAIIYSVRYGKHL
jgi:hypothetical protein